MVKSTYSVGTPSSCSRIALRGESLLSVEQRA